MYSENLDKYGQKQAKVGKKCGQKHENACSRARWTAIRPFLLWITSPSFSLGQNTCMVNQAVSVCLFQPKKPQGNVKKRQKASKCSFQGPLVRDPATL